MTYRTSRMLVCVYYRVAADDSRRVISGVREFQRTLQQRGGLNEVEVLLRCDLPPPASTAPPPDARTPSVTALDPTAGPDASADATVMETYRLDLPAPAGAEADAVVRAFLDTLDAASLPLASLLRGARHVELFCPCAL